MSGQIIDILCITSRMRMGGVQMFLMNYAEPLLHRGIRMNFAVDTTEPQHFDARLHELGCKIYPVTPIGQSRRQFMADIRRLLREHPELKIVHSHINYANVFALTAALGLGRKRIAHAHSTFAPTSLANRMAKVALRAITPLYANAYWGCSRQAMEWLFGRRLAGSKHAEWIRNAIDTRKFTFSPELRQATRQELGVEPDTFVWVHTGSFGPVKNHEFLLSLFAAWLKQHPDSHLVLCGDGELRPQIEAQIAELGIGSKVTLTGVTDRTPAYLSAADTFILPSHFEGFSFSLIEAQASGLTTTTTTAVPPDAKLANVISLPPTFVVEEWLEAMERQYEASKTIDRTQGAETIRAAGFDIETEATRLAKLYQELMS